MKRKFVGAGHPRGATLTTGLGGRAVTADTLRPGSGRVIGIYGFQCARSSTINNRRAKIYLAAIAGRLSVGQETAGPT